MNKTIISLLAKISFVFLTLGVYSLVTLFKNDTNLDRHLKDDYVVNATTDVSTLTVNSNQLGPFYSGASNTTFTIKYISSVGYSNIVDTFQYGKTSTTISYSSSSAVHSVVAGREYTFSWTFPGNQVVNNGKLFLRISIKDRDTSTNLFDRSTDIYAATQEELYVNAMSQKSKNYPYLTFKITNSSPVRYSDALGFSQTLDFIDVDYYYKLDLSSFSFLYRGNGLMYDSAEIIFNDLNNVFKNHSKEGDGLIHIPLTLYLENTTDVKAKLARGYYVKPKTLEISDMRLTSYIPTNYFFFPINKLEQMNNYSFLIRIMGIGYNKTNIRLSLDYDVSRRLLGNCYNSEYCIVGGIKK